MVYHPGEWVRTKGKCDMPRNTDDANEKKSQSFKEFSAQRRQARSASVSDEKRQRREKKEQEEQEKRESKARMEAIAEKREAAARQREAANAQKRAATAQKREAASLRRQENASGEASERRLFRTRERLRNAMNSSDARDRGRTGEERYEAIQHL